MFVCCEYVIALFLILGLACNGKNTASRTSMSQPEAQSDNLKAQSEKRPTEDGEGVTGYEQVKAPVPISGTNLVQLILSRNCVNTIGGSTPCSEIRWSAKVKVGTEGPFPIEFNTLKALDIKSTSWNIAGSANVNCLATGEGFELHPKCSSIDGSSLSKAVIEGSLTIEAGNGKSFTGVAPLSEPLTQGAFYGNFMLMDADSGIIPSGENYGYGSNSFTEIWQDLINGVFFTNILYSGNSNIDWDLAYRLCESLRTKDGSGGWAMPSKSKLFEIADHGLASSVPTKAHPAANQWIQIANFWTHDSTTLQFAEWVHVVRPLAFGASVRYETSLGVVCTR